MFGRKLESVRGIKYNDKYDTMFPKLTEHMKSIPYKHNECRGEKEFYRAGTQDGIVMDDLKHIKVRH